MADIKEAIQRLPDSPGVYRFYNSSNELIYIGKAKNLKKRVNSYFTKAAGVNRKTLKLVSEVAGIEYTVSDTEFDALLLENNFIKQNQPKYNILLKDDKTFPYICILKERFPRIIYTRKYNPEQGEYFGPYSSVSAMKNVLDLVRKLYSIRTCSLLLNQQSIEQQKFKVCLEYHIGNCKAPCIGNQSENEYREEIEQARNILKGDLSIVQQYFKKQMQDAAENMEFERAQRFKEKLNTLERFQSKSMVVNRSLTDIDVLTITSTEFYAYINYMQIKEGAIVFSKSVEIKKNPETSPDEWAATSEGKAIDYLPRDMNILRLVEDVIFDKRRSRLYYDLQAIQIIVPGSKTTTQVDEELGWFKYKDLEKVFRNHPKKAVWFNRQNTAQNKNFADAFLLRLFHGNIRKIENPDDETIFEIYQANGRSYREAVWATEWAELELMEKEHNLWEF